MPEIPFLDIHTHRRVSVADVVAVENVFVADILKYNTLKNSFLSVGLHPWHINNLSWEKEILTIREFSGLPQFLAIGEAGLDRLCDVDFELQKEIFAKQLEIADSFNKPLIVHCVKAHQEIISIYKKAKSSAVLIFHGFNNKLQIAESLILKGFYLSFGPALLNQKSNAAIIFSRIPDDRIFLETDDSGISIEEIYSEAARIRKVSILEMKKTVFTNFEKCFKISI